MGTKECGCAESYSAQIYGARPMFEDVLHNTKGVTVCPLSMGHPMDAFTVYHGSMTTCCLFKEAVGHAVATVAHTLKTRAETYGPTIVDEIDITPLDQASYVQGFAISYQYSHTGMGITSMRPVGLLTHKL